MRLPTTLVATVKNSPCGPVKNEQSVAPRIAGQRQHVDLDQGIDCLGIDGRAGTECSQTGIVHKDLDVLPSANGRLDARQITGIAKVSR